MPVPAGIHGQHVRGGGGGVCVGAVRQQRDVCGGAGLFRLYMSPGILR